jgi:hypothetical protein
VHSQNLDLLPLLAERVEDRDLRPDLGWAAFLTADRLLQAETSTVLGALLSDPSLLAEEPAIRASFFARADVRDTSERVLLSHYLSLPDLGPRELDHFVDLFPNHTLIVGHRLVTRDRDLDIADQVDHLIASAEVVGTWLQEAQFEMRKPWLEQLLWKLQELIGSADRGGLLSPEPRAEPMDEETLGQQHSEEAG